MALTYPAQAYAFALKTTSMGALVRWSDPNIRFRVAQTGDADRDRLLTDAARRAALAWSIPAEVTVDVESAPIGTKVGWSADAPNDNVIAWAIGDWRYDDDMLALTFLHYGVADGEVLDADILMNDADYVWIDAELEHDDDCYDLANALTHELGHALGLGHSDIFTATMYASSAAMEVAKRDLDPDDVAGLGEVYAAVEDPSRIIEAPLESPYGCQSTPVDAPWLVLFTVLAALALHRRAAVAKELATMGGLGLVLAATALSARPAHASPNTATLEAIVAKADAIADVEVIAQAVESKHGLIVTVSELRVLGCRAGWCPRTIVLEQLGGEKDGVGLLAEGITPVKVGETLSIAAKNRGVRWRMVARDRGRLLDLHRPDPAARAALDRALRVAR